MPFKSRISPLIAFVTLGFCLQAQSISLKGIRTKLNGCIDRLTSSDSQDSKKQVANNDFFIPLPRGLYLPGDFPVTFKDKILTKNLLAHQIQENQTWVQDSRTKRLVNLPEDLPFSKDPLSRLRYLRILANNQNFAASKVQAAVERISALEKNGRGHSGDQYTQVFGEYVKMDQDYDEFFYFSRIYKHSPVKLINAFRLSYEQNRYTREQVEKIIETVEAGVKKQNRGTVYSYIIENGIHSPEFDDLIDLLDTINGNTEALTFYLFLHEGTSFYSHTDIMNIVKTVQSLGKKHKKHFYIRAISYLDHDLKSTEVIQIIKQNKSNPLLLATTLESLTD